MFKFYCTGFILYPYYLIIFLIYFFLRVCLLDSVKDKKLIVFKFCIFYATL